MHRECGVEEQRAKWREQHRRNREKRLARMRVYYAKNRAAVRAQVKEHRKVHGERLREIDRKRWAGERRNRSNVQRKINMQEQRMNEPWRSLLKTARERAARKKVPFALTEEWARATWTGQCAITGWPLQLGLQQRGPKYHSPSIDRIVPALGYVPDNCRFILWAVNAMKYDGTDQDLYTLAKAIVDNYSTISGT